MNTRPRKSLSDTTMGQCREEYVWEWKSGRVEKRADQGENLAFEYELEVFK